MAGGGWCSQLRSVDMGSGHELNVILELLHVIQEHTRVVGMPELFDSTVVIESGEDVHSKNELPRFRQLSVVLQHRLEPHELVSSAIIHALVIFLEEHSVQGNKSNAIVGEIVFVVASVVKSFICISEVEVWWAVLLREPQLKKLRVVHIGDLFIARHLIMNDDIIVSNSWQEYLAWEGLPQTLHVTSHDLFHILPGLVLLLERGIPVLLRMAVSDEVTVEDYRVDVGVLVFCMVDYEAD